jgi:hypothetical protein
MTIPIQEEPESTVGRRPDRVDHPEPHERGGTRSGAGARREKEEPEREAGGESRERERGEPPAGRSVEK